MEKVSIKKEFFFTLKVLVWVVIIILPFLFLTTYSHEKAHIREAEKLDISMKIEYIKWLPQKDWGTGRAVPVSKEDCEKFNSLSQEHKNKILHAGVYETTKIFSILFLISSILLIIYGKKVHTYNKLLFRIWLIVTLSFLVIIGKEIYDNVFSNIPYNDWNMKFIDCSLFD